MTFLSSFTKDPKKVRVYGLLALLSLLLVALSYYFKKWHYDEFVIHFTRDLGIAGLVGFLLAITIEELSHAEFRKLAEEERAGIKRDVFYYVYGAQLTSSEQRQ